MLKQISVNNKTLQSMQRMQTIDVFGGLNTGLRIREGSWNDAYGMSARNYPVLSTHKEGTNEFITGARCGGMVSVHTVDGQSSIAYVAGSKLYFKGGSLDGQSYDLGLTPVSEDDLTEQKQIVVFGSYILIWPDKKYINVNDVSDRGSMEMSYTITSPVAYPCHEDGARYTHIAYTNTEPQNPVDNDAWVGTEDDYYFVKVWNASANEWITETAPHVAIRYVPDDNVDVGDVVDISGLPTDTTGNAFQDGQHLVVAKRKYTSHGYALVFEGAFGSQPVLTDPVTVSRKVPDMDYVTVCENRVWGCKYGTVDGKPINEIYACKLGDFKNWNCYQGLSTDSYTASRGSDGPFTGAITYQGHPLFFKENFLEKVFPSSYGAHQIVTTSIRGIQQGCWRSAVVINEVLYYKSRYGVYAYNGSIPRSVSDDLGEIPREWEDTACGSEADVLYLQDGTNVFTYDTVRGIWHQPIKAASFELCGGFVNLDGDLYVGWREVRVGPGPFSSEWTLHKFNAETTGTQSWQIVSGVIGLDLAEQEYISRFVIRFATAGQLHLYLQYDDDGTWVDKGTVAAGSNTKIRSYVLNVSPRRCDTCRFKIVGNKKCDIYSIAKYVERGSDAAYQ